MPINLEALAGGFAEHAGELTLAYGLGTAIHRALEPAAVRISQSAWEKLPDRVLDPGAAAAIVAEDVRPEEWGQAEATRSGIDADRFDALLGQLLAAPALGELLTMLRRGTITPAQFEHGLRKGKLETVWDDAARELERDRLDLGAIATAIHRGIIAGEGTIIREPPAGEGRVQHVPQSNLSGLEEAAAHGIDPERLRVLVGNTGLPPALGEMLQLLNRDKVTADDVRRAVAQSNLRNEYMDVVLELRHQLPTARDFLENALRGYRDLAEAIDGAALHGMSAEHATLIYQNQGRPMALRQITQALARGGDFKPEPGEIEDPYRAAIVEGNLKPAYYDLAYANRYTLPGAFTIRGMAAAGELDQAETRQLLLDSGWPPDLAAKVSARWAANTTGAGKQEALAELEDEYAAGYIGQPELRAALEQLGYKGHTQDLLVALNDARRVKRYREKVVDAIAKSYVNGKVTDVEAGAELAELEITGEATQLLLALWAKLKRAANPAP